MSPVFSQNDSAAPALERGLEILLLLADHPQGLAAHELAVLDLPRASLFRLLRVLRESGFVEQSERDARYRLGLKALTLGAAALRGLEVVREAKTHLQQVVEATRERAELALMDYPHLVIGDVMDIRLLPGLNAQRGTRVHNLHGMAHGKALLAWQPEIAARYIQEGHLHRLTEKTITDPDALRAELARIRERGYATDWGEHRLNVARVSAPVRGARGRVVAALGVAGPLFRIAPEKEAWLGALVRGAADDLSRHLGADRVSGTSPDKTSGRE
ncbi:MAG: IclR family transcriptional regulator [Armatimonadetes bacterium]|nr:IclR family transcriptional regulator [Armatimonadota bacterium]